MRSHWGVCWCWDPRHAQMMTWRTRQGLLGIVPISFSLLLLTTSFGHAKISRCLADHQDSQKSCRLRKQLQSPQNESVSKAEHSWLGSVSYVSQTKQLQAMYSTAKVFFPLSRASYWMSHALFLDITVFTLSFLREQSNHLINVQFSTAGSITIHAQGSALSHWRHEDRLSLVCLEACQFQVSPVKFFTLVLSARVNLQSAVSLLCPSCAPAGMWEPRGGSTTLVAFKGNHRRQLVCSHPLLALWTGKNIVPACRVG